MYSATQMFAKPKKAMSEGEGEKRPGWLSRSAIQAKKHQSLIWRLVVLALLLLILATSTRLMVTMTRMEEGKADEEKEATSNPKFEVKNVRGPFDPYTMTIETAKFPGVVPCFVEVSKESRNKYEWDHDLGVLTLDRVLHSAVYYPHDYGFIPQTLCGDGDPLDILVMSTSPLLPGCVVQCRPICYMVMEDEKGMDEKVLAVNVKDAHYQDIHTMKDLHEHTLREIAEFFATYKKLEKDKWAKVGGWRGTEDTLMLIKQAHENYKKQFELELANAPSDA